jgi:uncharacterized protein (TIGR02266 family)
VHPDEAVAIGAAVHAEALTEDKGEILLLDVTPFSLGIDSAGDVFTRIVSKNATIPVAESRTFTTVVDNQEKVKIVVRQGENKRASDNSFLGEFVLTGIRRAPRMEPKIDVVFRIDSNGILNVSAKDRFTGERQSIIIKDYFERATDPNHEAEPVIGSTGEEVAADGEAQEAEAGVGGRARGFLRRLVSGLTRKKAEEAETEETGEEGDELEEMPPAPDAVVLAAPQEQAPPPPPIPRAARPTFDPYAVVPHAVEPDAVEPAGAAAPPPPPMPPGAFPPGAFPPGAPVPPMAAQGDDPFANKVKSKTFGGQYTDPFAMLDRAGNLPGGADPFSMGGAMPDPFALDGVDPFAVQEKRPLSGGRNAPPPVSDDLLGSFDIDKLVDELSEGIPTISSSISDLPVPKSNLAPSAPSEAAWSGWQPPPVDAGLDDAMALSAAGVDPFAMANRVAERGLGKAPAWDDGQLPSERPAGARPAQDEITKAMNRGNNLPSGFVDEKANLPSGFVDERSNLPSGFIPDGKAPPPPTTTMSGSKKKPAKLKIAYKRVDAFVSEYSENLSRGGTFIKTPSPLDLGRECLFELTLPNREAPIYLNGVVVWSSKGMAQLEVGQEPGMGIKYVFDDNTARRKLEVLLDELRVSGQ